MSCKGIEFIRTSRAWSGNPGNANVAEYPNCNCDSGAPLDYDANCNIKLRIGEASPREITDRARKNDRTEKECREPYVEHDAPRSGSLTFDLSGLPKASPLEGRAGPQDGDRSVALIRDCDHLSDKSVHLLATAELAPSLTKMPWRQWHLFEPERRRAPPERHGNRSNRPQSVLANVVAAK
jgi:hypothetical protein